MKNFMKDFVFKKSVYLFSFVIVLCSFYSLNSYSQIYGLGSDLFYERSRLMWELDQDAEKIHQRNLEHIQEFIEVDVEKNSPENPFDPISDDGKAQYLNPLVADSVLRDAKYHPVVSFYANNKYDPENLGIGFCFGRAMYTHLELLYRGFDRESVKKAFVIGPMDTGDGNQWAWHVTTIAQSWELNPTTNEYEEVWLVIDPITHMQTLTEWYLEMRENYSTDGKLALFISESGQFGPNSYYTQQEITNSFYNDYFIDLMEQFASDSRGGVEKYMEKYYIDEYLPMLR